MNTYILKKALAEKKKTEQQLKVTAKIKNQPQNKINDKKLPIPRKKGSKRGWVPKSQIIYPYAFVSFPYTLSATISNSLTLWG